MKLFDLFLHCHIDEKDNPVFDAYIASISFAGDERVLRKSLPSLLFADRTRIPKEPSCHYFVLTINDGTRYYGCAVNYNDNSCLSAYALASALPFWQTMKNILTLIDPKADVSYLVRIPMPPPGINSVNFVVEKQNFLVFRPPPNQLPLIDLPFWLPFALFGPDELIVIFTAILTERRVVFSSKYPAAIAPFIESLVALTYPLECFSTYIPFLIKKLEDLLDSPLPFLIGVDPRTISLDNLDPGVIRVDLDTGKLTAGEFPPEIPKKQQQKLWKKMNKLCKRFNVKDRKMFLRSPSMIKQQVVDSDKQFDFSVPKTSVFPNLVNGLCKEMCDNGKKDLFMLYEKVRAAFLRFLVVIMMNDPEISGKEYDLSCKFNEDFLNTQTYQMFNERAKHFNRNKKVSTMEDARILFFKESVEAKKNRSMLRRKKRQTPFLCTQYWHVYRMYVFRPSFTNPVDFVKNLQEVPGSFDHTEKILYVDGTYISSPTNWLWKFPEESKKELAKMTDKKAGLVIQKNCRMFLWRAKFKKMRVMAVVICSFAKMANAKNFYEKKMKPAALKLHSTVRMFLVKTHYRKMRAAAIQIESTFRMFVAKVQYKRMKAAAVKIESTLRMFLAKTHFKQMKTAAVKVESTFRMFVAKTRFKQMKTAAVKVESTFRMFVAKVQYKHMRNAAVTIEATLRMFRQRKSYLARLKEATEKQNQKPQKVKKVHKKVKKVRKHKHHKEEPAPPPPPPVSQPPPSEEARGESALQLFARIWRARKTLNAEVDKRIPTASRVVVNKIVTKKIQEKLTTSEAPLIDRCRAVVEKNGSVLEESQPLGKKEKAKEFKKTYGQISKLQKKVMKRKNFDKVFSLFDIKVKGKRRKAQLLHKIQDVLSTDAGTEDWKQLVLAANIILVADGTLPLESLTSRISRL